MSFSWFGVIIEGIRNNLSPLLGFQWDLTTNSFRSFLFLNLIWFLLLLAAWILNKDRGIFFVISLITYLSVIDSVFAYDSKWLVIQSIVIGLTYIAFEKQKMIVSQVSSKKHYSLQWIIVAFIFALIASGIGFISPKAEATWTDPTGWLSKFNGKGIYGVSVKKIGYSEDDSYLGGPFEQDDTEIMRTRSSKRVYWRGESKNYYTGHGWIESEDLSRSNISMPVQDLATINNPVEALDTASEREYIVQSVVFQEKTFRTLFVGGELKSIEHTEPKASSLIQINPFSGNFYLQSDKNKDLVSYSITGTRIILDEDQIRNTPTDVPGLISSLFLQLPETLPQRITDLANEITTGDLTQYDQAKSIEQYLRNNYRYETEDVPVPKKEDDFVDQFLFESQQGYCDHFSSSMVVMSRSVGIPARWVKGFTAGDTTYTQEYGYEGIVKNQNAHSWAELYFPEIGWIPFEPTASFSMPIEYKREEQDSVETSVDDLRKSLRDKELLGMDDDAGIGDIDAGDSGISNFAFKQYFLIVSVLLFFLLIIFYYFRVEIWYFWKKNGLRRERDIRNLIISLTNNILTRRYIRSEKKRPDETVREYFSNQNEKISENIWLEATEMFESARYSNLPLPKQWNTRIWSVWKKIIQLMRS